MQNTDTISEKHAHELIADELFDLTLYKKLRSSTSDDRLISILDQLIAVEIGHLAFWEKFFSRKDITLSFSKKIKLFTLVSVCAIGRAPAVHLTLEAIEIYGIKKYLRLWRMHHGHPLGDAIKTILEDELRHEDDIVSQMKERKINPERIRSVFLGFNDGSVEILGAISGFFAAFGDASSVLIAGITVAVAGAISMGAGSFAALSSEFEVKSVEEERTMFLRGECAEPSRQKRPLSSALLVALSYFIGASAPILPVLLGATSFVPSMVFAGCIIVIISLILAFLSGMKVRKRILMNLGIICMAVGVSYLIGYLVTYFFGINVQ